jgi:3',5'-cyclic AMP phosphodiesterase CpdA
MTTVTPARLRELLGKRAIGHYNWHKKRHAIHRRDLLAQLVADIHAQQPDHIAITGDLVNIALPLEFAQAKSWLESVGVPQNVSLVPGNHDAYVTGIDAHFPTAWSAYMKGDNAPAVPVTFPYVRHRGPVALIGVSSAVPSAPFMATGRLGQSQRDDLEKLLPQLAAEQLFRVILIHHPPITTKGRWTARLTDSRNLLDLLKKHGAELVLHGHDHRHATSWLDGPSGKIPAIGVPSASAAVGGRHTPAAYNLFEISRNGKVWDIAMVSRGLSPIASASSEKPGVVELRPIRPLRF